MVPVSPATRATTNQMSTHASIIRKTETGTFEGVYLHSDGYPSFAGQLLLNHYCDPETVKALIALGDLSFLAKRANPIGDAHSFGSPERDTTVAYHRDRKEPLHIAIGNTVDEVVDQIDGEEYVYLFENGKWTVNGESLREALGMAEPVDDIAVCSGIHTEVLRRELARRDAAAANGLF